MNNIAIANYLNIFNELIEKYHHDLLFARATARSIMMKAEIESGGSIDFKLEDLEVGTLELVTLRSYLELLEKTKIFYKASYPIAHRARMSQYLNALQDLLEGREDRIDEENGIVEVKIWDTEIRGHREPLLEALKEMIVDPAPLDRERR